MIFSYLLNMQSHPSWVCGLKLVISALMYFGFGSHPSWVCGLKHVNNPSREECAESHPSWVCGLKPYIYNKK